MSDRYDAFVLSTFLSLSSAYPLVLPLLLHTDPHGSSVQSSEVAIHDAQFPQCDSDSVSYDYLLIMYTSIRLPFPLIPTSLPLPMLLN